MALTHHHHSVMLEQLKIVGIFYELNLPRERERVGVTSDPNPIILSRIIRTRVHLDGWIDKWYTAEGDTNPNWLELLFASFWPDNDY